MVKQFGGHNMTVLYSNPCYNKVFYKGLYYYHVAQIHSYLEPQNNANEGKKFLY